MDKTIMILGIIGTILTITLAGACICEASDHNQDYTIMTPDGPVTIRDVTSDQTGEPLIIWFTEV